MATRDIAPAVYDMLRALAHRHLRKSGGNTLNTTALVHEAWLKLMHGESDFENRAHFFAVAATAMRQSSSITRDVGTPKSAAERRRRGNRRSRTSGQNRTSMSSSRSTPSSRSSRLSTRASHASWSGGSSAASTKRRSRALDVDVRTVRRDWRARSSSASSEGRSAAARAAPPSLRRDGRLLRRNVARLRLRTGDVSVVRDVPAQVTLVERDHEGAGHRGDLRVRRRRHLAEATRQAA